MYSVASAEGRVNLPSYWSTNFLRGVGCNWLVGLAFFLAIQSKEQVSQIYSVWIPIWAFVGLGFVSFFHTQSSAAEDVILGTNIVLLIFPRPYRHILWCQLWRRCIYLQDCDSSHTWPYCWRSSVRRLRILVPLWGGWYGCCTNKPDTKWS
jgi:hypothetical protein